MPQDWRVFVGFEHCDRIQGLRRIAEILAAESGGILRVVTEPPYVKEGRIADVCGKALSAIGMQGSLRDRILTLD
ncbi:hypothetical protein NTCA1_49590 [Novosphingobium sp. TCA1]|nr:hypothetical protein NTCA1_49590 [Novosphingobium sp. TCA1]